MHCHGPVSSIFQTYFATQFIFVSIFLYELFITVFGGFRLGNTVIQSHWNGPVGGAFHGMVRCSQQHPMITQTTEGQGQCSPVNGKLSAQKRDWTRTLTAKY